MHLVWASAQNIDRMVTVFRAAKRTGRVLVMDLYAAVVLEATGRDSIPQSHWEQVRLYVPQPQRVFIKENGLFEDLKRHSAHRVFAEQLPAMQRQVVMLFRPMALRDRGVTAILGNARLTYSMWGGYLKEQYTRRVVQSLEREGVSWDSIHTSGHASVKDLQAYARGLAPRTLVPIHSFETGRFAEFFDNVVRKDDGVWWEV